MYMVYVNNITHPETAPKAVGYIRVSTDMQVAEGVSLDAQRMRIEAWAAANGYGLLRIHEDAGISGGRASNRPGLQAALDDACSHKAVLVVYSLSRLARSTMDAITISNRLNRAGADLASISEKIDTTSASGKMIFRMLAVLAEFEKDQISERTTSSMRHLRTQGKRIGGIPYGYDLADDGESLMLNEHEQAGLRKILQFRNDGLSYRMICQELVRQSVKTKKGNLQWSPKVIRNVILRAKECGQVESNQKAPTPQQN
jgi:site-specific DNA recombinase